MKYGLSGKLALKSAEFDPKGNINYLISQNFVDQRNLEMKLQKSFIALSEEIDGLKDPLHDIIQDIDKDR